MEVKKTNLTAAPEELDDKVLAQASGGCVFGCDYTCEDYFFAFCDDKTRTYKAYKCKNCGAEHYYRQDGGNNLGDSTVLHEVSFEEYDYYRHQWGKK